MKLALIIIVYFFSLELVAQDSLKFEFSDSVFIVGQEHTMEFRWTISGFRFVDDFNSPRLDSIRYFMLLNKSISIVIEEHTDSRGAKESNLKLSELRAKGIKNKLMTMGISEDRIEAIGKGESEPIHTEEEINQYKQTDPNKFEQLHQINRRTIIRITSI